MGADSASRGTLLQDERIWQPADAQQQEGQQQEGPVSDDASIKTPARAARIVDIYHVIMGGLLPDDQALEELVKWVVEEAAAGVEVFVFLVDGRDPAKHPVPGSIQRSTQLIAALYEVFGKDGGR